MARWHRTITVGLIALHLLCVAATAGLRDDVERLIRNSQLKGGVVGLSIRDGETGASLVAINSDLPMTPASNMKLITSGAALHALGADFEFMTRLVRDGDRLIVVGDGDPAFGDPELLKDMTLGTQKGVDVEAFIDLWVKAAAATDLKQVREVVVDDRIFDREVALPIWPGDEPNRYCPQIAGFNFHGNVLHFLPRPRKGQSPEIGQSKPHAPWLKITNQASSRDGQQDKNDLWIARKLGTNDFTFRGNVRFAYKSPVQVNVHDMPDFFAHLLADRLRKANIEVKSQRIAAQLDGPSGGHTVGPVICTPISTVIRRCNTNSDNLYAECLLKRTGHAMTSEPGSWINGTAIIRHIMHQRLDDPTLLQGVVIVDGSGLSNQNKITARAMTAWLHSIGNDPAFGSMFIDSLAIGGQSGTLRTRMNSSQLRGAMVYAKTGYINNVSCLSGYVITPDGRRRSFSVLVNNLKEGGTVAAAKKLQDQIVAAIAEDMASAKVTLGSD